MRFFAAGTVMVLIAAAFIDGKKSKVPNILLIVLLSFQLLFFISQKLILGSTEVTLDSVIKRILAMMAVFAFLYPFFCISKLGAGDVKLISLTVLSVERPLTFLMAVFLIGAFIGLLKLIFKQNREKTVVHMALPVLLGYICVTVPSMWGFL